MSVLASVLACAVQGLYAFIVAMLYRSMECTSANIYDINTTAGMVVVGASTVECHGIAIAEAVATAVSLLFVAAALLYVREPRSFLCTFLVIWWVRLQVRVKTTHAVHDQQPACASVVVELRCLPSTAGHS